MEATMTVFDLQVLHSNLPLCEIIFKMKSAIITGLIVILTSTPIFCQNILGGAASVETITAPVSWNHRTKKFERNVESGHVTIRSLEIFNDWIDIRLKYANTTGDGKLEITNACICNTGEEKNKTCLIKCSVTPLWIRNDQTKSVYKLNHSYRINKRNELFLTCRFERSAISKRRDDFNFRIELNGNDGIWIEVRLKQDSEKETDVWENSGSETQEHAREPELTTPKLSYRSNEASKVIKQEPQTRPVISEEYQVFNMIEGEDSKGGEWVTDYQNKMARIAGTPSISYAPKKKDQVQEEMDLMWSAMAKGFIWYAENGVDLRTCSSMWNAMNNGDLVYSNGHVTLYGKTYKGNLTYDRKTDNLVFTNENGEKSSLGGCK